MITPLSARMNEERAMVDCPIIFSAPMIRALLDGRKTMTRRLAWRDAKFGLQDYASEQIEEMELKGWNVVGEGNDGLFRVYEPSPWQKVKPGDRLWVRESVWRCANDYGDRGIIYMATGEPPKHSAFKSCRSIHMPRWASRLTLTVTATKIERLQDISEEDAIAEGMPADPSDRRLGCDDSGFNIKPVSARQAFADLWESLHGRDLWNANPEVVAISFVVHRQNIDAMERAA